MSSLLRFAGWCLGVLISSVSVAMTISELKADVIASPPDAVCEAPSTETVVRVEVRAAIPCDVVRVVDGDTVVVLCELLAGDTYRKFAVRPPAVDAAERYTEAGIRATAWTKGWVDSVGSHVLYVDEGPGKYAGRRLGDLHPVGGGLSWSEALRAAGHDKRSGGGHE